MPPPKRARPESVGPPPRPKRNALMVEEFVKIIRLMRFNCHHTGLDFWRPKYGITWRTMIAFTFCTFVIPMLVYTVLAKERTAKIRASTMFGIMGQASLKTFIFFARRQPIVNLMYYLRHLYLRNYRTANGNEVIMLWWIQRFWLAARMVCVVIISGITTYILYPLFMRFFYDENELILPMYYPYVDENTTWGLVVMGIIHTMLLFMGLMGILGSDLIYWILLLHMCPMSDMLIRMLKEMDDRVKRTGGVAEAHRRPHEELRIREYLHNIVRLHTELFTFMNGVNDVFELINLVEVGSNALSMCLLIFAYYLIKWFPLYVFFGVVSVKLFIMCLLGTIVDIFYERMIKTIEQSHWYLLSVQNQKTFMLLMLRAQESISLIAGTSVVNLNFGVSILKTIYSVAMLLNEMEVGG